MFLVKVFIGFVLGVEELVLFFILLMLVGILIFINFRIFFVFIIGGFFRLGFFGSGGFGLSGDIEDLILVVIVILGLFLFNLELFNIFLGLFIFKLIFLDNLLLELFEIKFELKLNGCLLEFRGGFFFFLFFVGRGIFVNILRIGMFFSFFTFFEFSIFFFGLFKDLVFFCFFEGDLVGVECCWGFFCCFGFVFGMIRDWVFK